MLIGEPAAGAAHSGLDLVQDQEHSALVAQLPKSGEVIRRGDIDAPLALDGFDENRGRLIVQDRGDRAQVVVGHVDEAGHHRLEADVILGLGRRRQRGIGPAVEAPLHGHDLEPPVLVAISPRQLDGGLVGFGSAVAEKTLPPNDRFDNASASAP